MSNPTGITMAALQLLNSSACVLKKGSTVLGQTQGVTPRATIPTEKVGRIGDTAKSTSYKPGEFSVQIRMWSDYTFNDLAEMLGVTTPVDSESIIKLDPTIAAFDLTLEIYDGATGVADELKGTLTITNFKPTTWELPIDPDANPVHTLDGECDEWHLVPETGA